MGSKYMTAEQSTFMIDLQQIGMMLRQVKFKLIRIISNEILNITSFSLFF